MLQKCYECAYEVSDLAKACPHCGAPVERNPPPNAPKSPQEAFFIQSGEVVTGPHTLMQMREMYREREIDEVTLYSCDGPGNWVPVRHLLSKLLPKEENAQKPDAQKDSSPLESDVSNLPQKNASSTSDGKSDLQALGIVCIAIAVIAILIPIVVIASNHSSDPVPQDQNLRRDAYIASEEFIKKRFPGAKSISPFRESFIERSGETFSVAVIVDGLNAFGGPVRNRMTVGLKRNETGDWVLLKIDQR